MISLCLGQSLCGLSVWVFFLFISSYVCVLLQCPAVQHSPCDSGIASQVHEFLGWEHPKITGVFVFFFTGRDWQSLYFVGPMSPFNYKKELTLVQKLALQNAQWITPFCLLHTWPELTRLLLPWESQLGSRGTLHCVGRPMAPTGHSEDAGAGWRFSVMGAESSCC